MLWNEQLLHSNCNLCMTWRKPIAESPMIQTTSVGSLSFLPTGPRQINDWTPICPNLPSCMSGLHIAQLPEDCPTGPIWPCRQGRVPVVGHPNQIANTSSNRHGRVPVVGFSFWLAMVDILSERKSSGAMARRELTSPGHFRFAFAQQIDLMPNIHSGRRHQSPPNARSSPCEDLQDDRQSTHEKTLRGGLFLTLFSLRMSHHSFTIFFTRPAYRLGRYASVLVMPARPHNAISGILAGGILGFGIATFLLWHQSAHPVMSLFACCFRRMACSVLGTQVALSHHFSPRRVMMLPFHWFLLGVWLFWFVFWLFLVLLLVFVFFVCGCCSAFLYSSVERHHTSLALRTQEAATALASLAGISAASKHLHNDLAKAIEALEQKKNWKETPVTRGSNLCFPT